MEVGDLTCRSVGVVGLLVALACGLSGCQATRTVSPVCMGGADVPQAGYDCGTCSCGTCDCREASDCPQGEVDADFCVAWDADLEAANLTSLRRFALSQATSVVTGSFGTPRVLQENSYVPLTIEEVPYGWSFLAGTSSMVKGT